VPTSSSKLTKRFVLQEGVIFIKASIPREKLSFLVLYKVLNISAFFLKELIFKIQVPDDRNVGYL
jgi:hypothetical protein